jgi:hypothetical protein
VVPAKISIIPNCVAEIAMLHPTSQIALYIHGGCVDSAQGEGCGNIDPENWTLAAASSDSDNPAFQQYSHVVCLCCLHTHSIHPEPAP